MMRGLRIQTLLCVVHLLLAPFVWVQPVSGYTVFGAKWHLTDIPVEYKVNTAGSTVGVNTYSQTLATSFSTWASVPTTSMQFDNTGATTRTYETSQQIDYQNTMGWADLPAGVLGVTLIWSYAGQIIETDMYMTTNQPISTTGDVSSFDLETVLSHEIGHIVGLDHVSDLDDLMYPYLSPGQLKRSLSSDNRAGISYLYPGSGTASQAPPRIESSLSAPNPFRPTAHDDYCIFSFILNEGGHIRLDILNLAGELVKTVLDQELAAGAYQGPAGFRWYGDAGRPDARGEDIGSGVYLYMISADGSNIKSGKLMVIR